MLIKNVYYLHHKNFVKNNNTDNYGCQHQPTDDA